MKCTQRVPNIAKNIVVRKLLIQNWDPVTVQKLQTVLGLATSKQWLFYVLDQFATHGLQCGQNWKDN